MSARVLAVLALVLCAGLAQAHGNLPGGDIGTDAQSGAYNLAGEELLCNTAGTAKVSCGSANQFVTTITDSATNTISHEFVTRHLTSGTPAVGYGVGHRLELQNASGTYQHAAALSTWWTSATGGAETSSVCLKTYKSGGLTCRFTLDKDGIGTLTNTLKTAGNAVGLDADGTLTLQSAADGQVQIVDGVAPTWTNSPVLGVEGRVESTAGIYAAAYDSVTAAALNVGGTNATAVYLARSGVTTYANAALYVYGLTTMGGGLRAVISSDLTSGSCTANTVAFDTVGTKELCYCGATNTWTCWSATCSGGTCPVD